MLAVRPESQDTGLGMRLKACQRGELIAKGITRMLWTYDSLEAKNAHFNLNKLGVTAGEFVQDMHGWPGPDPGADHGVKRTFEVGREGSLELPGEPDLTIDADRILVPIPRSIQVARDASFEAALRWPTVPRSVLSTYRERGFEAREFYTRNGWSEYLLVSQDRLT